MQHRSWAKSEPSPNKMRIYIFNLISRLLFSVVLTAFVFSARPCLSDDNLNVSKAHLQTVKLQLKWKHQFQFAGYYAALEKGFYREAGLDVKILEIKDGEESIENVIEGKADFGVAMSDLILHRAKGQPVVALAAIFQHSPLIILAPKASGVENIHALKGNRLGMEAHSAELIAYLENEGISLEEIELLPHDYSISKLISGKVDAISAYSTDEPFVLLNQGVEYSTFSPRAGGIDFYGDTLFTSETEIRENPERVSAFLAATLRGWQYALENSEEIIELILSKYTKRHSREHLLFEAQHSKTLIMADVVQLGYMNPGRWNHIAQTYAKLGMIDENFSLDGFLHTSGSDADYGWLKRILGILIAICLLLCFGALLLAYFNRKLSAEISERKRVEEALRESEKKYKTLIEAMPDMVWEFDENEVFTFCSESYREILGYEPFELVGKSAYSLMPAVEVDKVREKFEKIKRERRPFKDLVNLNLTKQGKPKWLLSSAVPIMDHDGNCKGYRGIDKDITEMKAVEEERKMLEAQLLQSHKMEAIGTLTGGIAHDYNNIMSVIMGNLSMAMEEAKPGSLLVNFLSAANTASHKVRDLTHELMALSKGGDPVKELRSLRPLLKSASDIITPENAISYNESISQDLWQVPHDPYNMGAVFRNVVTNAVEAMSEGGTLTITAENLQIENKEQYPGLPLNPGDYVHISFQDQGVGIPEAHLNKIFDPYFSTKAMGTQKGMGLGLATAYAIVQKHGGHIDIHSSSGAGTTVNIYLPAESQPEEIDITTPSAGNKASPVKRVLVMDDEEMLRKLVRQMLERMGYAVETVKDGVEAIAAYQSQKDSGEPFDAVILDLTIKGGMGGEQTIRELLKIDPGIKAIVSSGYFNDPVMSDFQKYGFMGAMPKPYEKSALKKMLEKLSV